jgi:hypothetical protein
VAVSLSELYCCAAGHALILRDRAVAVLDAGDPWLARAIARAALAELEAADRGSGTAAAALLIALAKIEGAVARTLIR